MNSLKDVVGGNGYCQGDTFYIVAQVYSRSKFQNLRNSSDLLALLASSCSAFDELLRAFNSQNNLNLRGNFAYVFEYGGQRIQYSCP